MKKLLTYLLLLSVGISTALAAGPSGTLPVIYINIENGAEVVSKETYLSAEYWLDPNGSEGIDALGSSTEPLTMKIKGRGNYTFTGFDKKPYRLKLDTKQKMLGLKSSKHFGLLAHADDSRGFLRNTIGFEVSKGFGLPWTPEQKPIEVVINGTYRGLYFLVELIRIDKDRVNISKWVEEDEAGNPLDKWIEGGSLIEIDNYEEEGQVSLTDGDGYPMRITYDKSVDPGYEPDGYREWLTEQFTTMNSLIYGDKNSDEIWNYIDIDDCAKYILVQELTNNYESFHGSCYMHREKGVGEKWHFSPVWDFGSALQLDNFPLQHFWENPTHHNHWVAQLWQFPKLQEKMKEHWNAFKKDKYPSLASFIDNFASSIKEAAACDKERWPMYGNENLTEKANYAKIFLSDSEKYFSQVFGSEVVDGPKDFVVPEDEDGIYHLFFKQTGKAEEWPNVKMFYWGENLSATWPGYDCEYVRIDNVNYWHYKLITPVDSENYMIIFDNGQSGVGENQTEDLFARKRGVYTLDMPRHAIPSEFLAVGAGTNSIDNVSDVNEQYEIKVVNGALVVIAPESGEMPVYSIDGTVRNITISEGENMITLPRGIYIVGGNKVAM